MTRRSALAPDPPEQVSSGLGRPGLTLAVAVLAPLAMGAARPNAPACGWRPGETLQVTGVVSQGGLSGPFERLTRLGTGQWRERIDLGLVASAAGYDGRQAWSQDVSGASHDLDSTFARALSRSEAWLAATQGCLAGPPARRREVGTQTEGGRRLRVTEVTPPGGATFELWTDEATGRPDRAIFQHVENRVIRRFADWRDLGGGRFVAFEQRDEDPEDQDITVYKAASARLAAAPAAAFERPAPRQDVRLPPGRTSTTVPYEDDGRTRIYLPVWLDGHGPFTFELDNGGHFIATAETARTAGLTASGAFASTGAGVAIAQSGFARVHELKVGDAVISDQPMRVRALPAAANDRGQRPPRAGILGIELFERFTVAIDRRAHTVTLTPRGVAYPKPRGRALPLVFAEDAPLTPGAFEGVAGDMMLDIGNAGATIVEEAWAAPRGLAARFDRAPEVGDQRLARGTVSLGPFRLPGEVVSYYGRVARGSEATRGVAGVLGEPLLSRFDATYDVARKTVWLSPAAGVGLKPFNRAGLVLAKAANGDLTARAVLPGSPAADAGLAAGMVVTVLDGRPAATVSRQEAAMLFEQPVGTVVRVTLRAPDGAVSTLALKLREVLQGRSRSR